MQTILKYFTVEIKKLYQDTREMACNYFYIILREKHAHDSPLLVGMIGLQIDCFLALQTSVQCNPVSDNRKHPTDTLCTAV